MQTKSITPCVVYTTCNIRQYYSVNILKIHQSIPCIPLCMLISRYIQKQHNKHSYVRGMKNVMLCEFKEEAVTNFLPEDAAGTLLIHTMGCQGPATFMLAPQLSILAPQ